MMYLNNQIVTWNQDEETHHDYGEWLHFIYDVIPTTPAGLHDKEFVSQVISLYELMFHKINEIIEPFEFVIGDPEFPT